MATARKSVCSWAPTASDLAQRHEHGLRRRDESRPDAYVGEDRAFMHQEVTERYRPLEFCERLVAVEDLRLSLEVMSYLPE